MKRQPSNELQLSSSETHLTRRAKMLLAGAAFGVSALAGGVAIHEDVMDSISSNEADLKNDTISYEVDEGGYIWNVAASIKSNADIRDVVKLIEELNPEYTDSNIIPDGAVIEVPRAFVNQDDSSIQNLSLDLDQNTAIIRH